MKRNHIYCVDALKGLKKLESESVDMLITSPPYFQLRDYKVNGQIGLEDTVEDYLNKLFDIFTEAQRVIKADGTCWVNMGDRYGDKKHRGRYKSMLGIPEQFMLGMQKRGWIVRNKIIWHKPNPVPASAKDRLTNSWEYLYLFVKSPSYYFDLDAIRQPHKTQTPKTSPSEVKVKAKAKDAFMKESGVLTQGTANMYCQKGVHWYNAIGKNPGDCWTIPPQPFRGAHFATYPERLIEAPILTSPQSICTQCGEPRRRITQAQYTKKSNNRSNMAKQGIGDAPHIGQPAEENLASPFTIGWTACACKAPFKPALILDLFSGSGTTALVAKRLGRDFIGFDLNPEYNQLARKRIKANAS